MSEFVLFQAPYLVEPGVEDTSQESFLFMLLSSELLPTHVMTVSNSATSCCQGGCQPRRPASDRQAVYIDQCCGAHLMCSAPNVYAIRFSLKNNMFTLILKI